MPARVPPRSRPEFYVYIACGNDTSKGTVYQTDDTGRVVATVSLPFTPTGMGLVRNHALALAIPRDGGKILEIDNNGHVSTILERDRSLLHPIRVAVPGDSDTVVVADNISQVLASTTTEGVKPTIYQQFNWQKPNPGMYVAMTRDNHVIFSSDATPGVYRYESQGSASAKKAVLPGFGGVAADPRSLRWAAAQTTKEASLVYVFDGDKMLKTLRLPPNKSLYRNGLVSFSPKGDVCVAVQDSDKTSGPVTLLMYNLEKKYPLSIFTWDRAEMTDFVVGPPMPWNSGTVKQREEYPLVLRGNGYRGGPVSPRPWGGRPGPPPFFWENVPDRSPACLHGARRPHYHAGIVSHPA